MREYTTFEELLKPLSGNLLKEATNKFDADRYYKKFKTRDHLISMIYAQLNEVKSLRDLEVAFNSQEQHRKLVRCEEVKRSTLSDANCHRSCECFLWIATQLMSLTPRSKRKDIKKVVKILDSSPIQLKGRRYDDWTLEARTLRCQGLKLHVEYDKQIDMPTRVQISRANIDDCSIGQKWPILADTIYVFDRGYYDFNWWWSINKKKAFFVTRLKHNVAIKVIKKLHTNDKEILNDRLFEFKNKNPRGGKKNKYKLPLRQVVIRRENKQPIEIVTNLIGVPAETIAALYKSRWEIELFFKWIKQNLKIKRFLGNSKNAVKTQIVIALILYLLIGLFKCLFKHVISLHQVLILIRHNWNAKSNVCKHFRPPISKLYFTGRKL